ncbi:Peptidoglycan/LPS O-acetylase OafA/YrhL, contains acyltransferase and SGNH-hydrolase domains [Chryseobacterium soldanellicola]|uniref:Peptidoglycan/LPS O-acetylase OafA/YrhL, contains acyltransferase and SGNH-hydrolase domains n=1 Tax=Chryseobacterium soldanellicola TaxID=311333 RepID=A0A1H1A6V0_9FLAO|nr:acyltransferase [Chryseobacterium soldanellicola]SDQ35320.1 Peptidoglycan/LPS O-acetylase OafA/YrhL, contains acyltransferase and SGNH-hydrolase domains [Chryseobacterium soldanellicola]
MIKPLTSLRFFFAFCVFLSHLSYLKDDGRYKGIFNAVFSEGFLGVSFFFILSGFILALNYREKFISKKITFKKFYIARFARIYPLYFITMLASIPALYSSFKILLYNIFLLQSYIPDQNYFFSYNAPSWSISDEMFFYALFPVLIAIIYKLKKAFKIILVAGFVSLIIALNLILTEDEAHCWLYISPFTRIFDFILGILLFDVALYLKSKRSRLNQNIFNLFEAGGIFILVVFFIFHDDLPISYRFSIYYWLPMCLIILSAANSFILEKSTTLISKFLSWKWFVYLGEISFGFYLIHYLVITYLMKYNGLMGIHLKGIPFAAAMFIITLITSIFAFEVIEKPFNKKIKNLLL